MGYLLGADCWRADLDPAYVRYNTRPVGSVAVHNMILMVLNLQDQQ